jgi:hypothetical protein
MEMNTPRGRFGLMQPLRQCIIPMSDDPVPPDQRDHSFEGGGGDGFVPMMVAAGLLASAVLLALE